MEDANIKLSGVVSDMSGASVTKIVNALIEGKIQGKIQGKEFLQYKHGKMQVSDEDLLLSLEGKLSKHHKFMLKTIQSSIIEKEKLFKKLQKQIEKYLKANEFELDTELLSSIPRVVKRGAAYIWAEIGNDMEQFPDEKHLASWAGISPGNNESAGKKKVGG